MQEGDVLTRGVRIMTRLTSIVTSLVLATALLPVTAGAQATRRGGGSDGGGSSSSGSRGGSDSGGGGVAVPRNPSPQPSPRGEGGAAPSNSGSARPSGARVPSGSDTRVTSSGSGPNRGSQDLRLRSAQTARGVAQPRGNARPGPREPLTYGSRWTPWYGYGPSSYYNYGYYGYSPFLYGGASWSWNRYGWHDPYLFDPFGYAGYAPYYWQSSGGINSDQDNGVPTGSLRLRVSPGHARVYVDGALAGIASEFGGLTNHLTIPAGLHQLELRADGFATLSTEVNVEAGRTRTERLGLKKLPGTQPAN